MTDLAVTPAALPPAVARDLAILQRHGVTDPDQHLTRWVRYVLAWLAAHGESPHTRRAYAVDAAQWTAWCTRGGIDPETAVRAHIDTYAEHLRTRGGHGGRTAAPKTVARKLAAVASLYAYLVEEGAREHSPTVHVTRPSVSRDYAATISLDEPQVKAVLTAARGHSPCAYAVATLLALTGVRAAEALSATVPDLVVDHGHRCLRVVRKGGVEDRVVLPPAAAHAVDAYLAGRTDGPLFLRVDGLPLTYSGLRWMLITLGRAAGLPVALHPHMLRASFATISFDHGVGPDRIQDAMGHADPRTTRLYDRGRGKLRRKAEPGNVVAKFVMPDEEEG